MNLYNLPKGICSVMLGCAAAAYLGNFEVVPATLAFIFVIFIQITVNLQTVVNELQYYSDHVVCLTFKGVKVTVGKDLLLPIRMALVMFMILSLTSGLGLTSVGGWPALLVGAIIFGTLYIYRRNRSALHFSYLAPVMVFFYYGPVGVLGTYMLQTFNYSDYVFSWNDFYIPILLSFIAGFYGSNVWVLAQRMRNVLLPPDKKHFFAGKHARTLKHIFITNTILIFLLQIYLCLRAMENTVLLITFVPPVVCLLVNIFVWWRAKNVASGGVLEYRRLTIICLSGILFYALTMLVWCVMVHIRPDLTPTVFF